MFDLMIITKFLILFYMLMKYVTGSIEGTLIIILALLIYVSISMLYYIAKEKRIKKLILITSIIYTVVCYKFINEFFIFLLPIAIFELLGEYAMNIIIGLLVIILPLFILKKEIICEYVFISSTSYFLYMLVFKAARKIEQLTSEQDNQRIKVSELYERLNIKLEHENQIKYTTQLEERNKIAQQLHDKLGHTVSGSLMQLEAAKLVMESDIETSKAMIQNSIDALRVGMENIRQSLRNLKPPPEQVGVNRIKMMLDDFLMKSGIKSVLIYNGSIDLISYTQWNIFYENLAESLTNIVKYSHASSITVNIEVLNKFIKMEVRDNGIGALDIKKGLGIIGMEERAGNIGGKIIVDGSRGFSIITLLPIGGEDNGNKNNYSR